MKQEVENHLWYSQSNTRPPNPPPLSRVVFHPKWSRTAINLSIGRRSASMPTKTPTRSDSHRQRDELLMRRDSYRGLRCLLHSYLLTKCSWTTKTKPWTGKTKKRSIKNQSEVHAGGNVGDGTFVGDDIEDAISNLGNDKDDQRFYSLSLHDNSFLLFNAMPAHLLKASQQPLALIPPVIHHKGLFPGSPKLCPKNLWLPALLP